MGEAPDFAPKVAPGRAVPGNAGFDAVFEAALAASTPDDTAGWGERAAAVGAASAEGPRPPPPVNLNTDTACAR